MLLHVATIVVGLEADCQMPCKAMDNVDEMHKEEILVAKVEAVYVLHMVEDEMDIVDMVLDTISYAEDVRTTSEIDTVRHPNLRSIVVVGN